MKKIMFNDHYGLTKAVLVLIKKMTRRGVKLPDGLTDDDLRDPVMGIDDRGSVYFTFDCADGKRRDIYPQYQIGEVVAIAQTYKDCGWKPDVLQQTFVRKPTIFPDLDPISPHCGWIDLPFKYHKGWTNKMFVIGRLMRHYIRIKNIKAERLQDISDEDCLKEGIFKFTCNLYIYQGVCYSFEGDKNKMGTFQNPREAFAALIDKVSGKGTWASNPYVFAYSFELL